MRRFFRVGFIGTAIAIAVLATATGAVARGYLVTSVWGDPGTAPGELAAPKGAAVDAAGHVYVVDYVNDTVVKYAAGGEVMDVWGGHGSVRGKLASPSRVAVGPDGSVYVTDADNHRIQRFAPDGTVLAMWGHEGRGPGEFSHPRGIDVTADGTVYVTDQGNARVQVFTAGGRFLRLWGRRGSGRGRLSRPKDVAVGRNGRVYVVDAENDCVQVFSTRGRWLAVWGGHGSAAGRFLGPRGIAVDQRGHVFVADAYNDRVQEFTGGGTRVRLWGCRGDLAGQMMRPRDVAPAPDGSIVVVDTKNQRLQRFELSASSDATPPHTTSTLRRSWSCAPVTVELSAVDAGSAVAVTYVRRRTVIAFTPYTGPIVLDSEGTHRLQYLSVDAAGNQETVRRQTVCLDWTSPRVRPYRLTTARTTVGHAVAVRFFVADKHSSRCHMTLAVTRDGRQVQVRGLGWRRVSAAGRTQWIRVGARLSRGRYQFSVTVRDRAGNVGTTGGALVVR